MTRFHRLTFLAALLPAVVFAQSNTRCPNILLDFDVSGSMSSTVTGTSSTRYVVGRDAVISLINGNTANFRYGLIIFGTNDAAQGCGVSSCFYSSTNNTCDSVLSDNGTTPAITAVLNANGPTGSTPTASSISTAMTRSDMTDTTRARYIILITDGDPNCTGNTITDTVNALNSARTAGVKTYVLGFAGGSASNLNQMAIAGGTQRHASCDTGANKCYYDASNATELSAALAAIVSAVGGELGGGACDDTCYGGGCAAGQICKATTSGGQPSCQADPCANTNCPAPSVCVEGACKAPCSPACLSTEYCDNGVCKTAAACPATCPGRNQVCVNGQCTEDYCSHPQKAIQCSSGSLCIGNSCQDFGGGTGGGSGGGTGGTGGGTGSRDGGTGNGTNAGTGCCSGAPAATSLFGLLAGLSVLGGMRRRVRRTK